MNLKIIKKRKAFFSSYTLKNNNTNKFFCITSFLLKYKHAFHLSLRNLMRIPFFKIVFSYS